MKPLTTWAEEKTQSVLDEWLATETGIPHGAPGHEQEQWALLKTLMALAMESLARAYAVQAVEREREELVGPHLLDIFTERQRQDEKWGPQTHDNGWWTLIALEELGEAAKIALRLGSRGIPGGVADQDQNSGSVQELGKELVQAAAVIVAWLEDLEGRKLREEEGDEE